MNTLSIKSIFKLNQFIISLSLAYTGCLFAKRFELETWLLITIAVISSRIVYLVFNKIFENTERELSPRRQIRLVAKGYIKQIKLWIIGILCSGIFIFSSFIINELCYYISIAAVIVIVFFPLIKKYVSLSSMYFGIYESACVICGFIAANNRFEISVIFPALSVILWLFGYDLLSAIFEVNFDAEKKYFSIPRSIGNFKTQAISIICYLFSLSLLSAGGILTQLGLAYWISLFCFAIIAVRQQILLKSKDADTAKKESFQINNFIGPVIFIGALIDHFFR